MALFLHGDWRSALAVHPLGPAAVVILLGRVWRVLRDFFRFSRWRANS